MALDATQQVSLWLVCSVPHTAVSLCYVLPTLLKCPTPLLSFQSSKLMTTLIYRGNRDNQKFFQCFHHQSNQLSCTWVHVLGLLSSHHAWTLHAPIQSPSIYALNFVPFIYSWTSLRSPFSDGFFSLESNMLSLSIFKNARLIPHPSSTPTSFLCSRLWQNSSKNVVYTLSPINQLTFSLGPFHSGFLSTTHRNWSCTDTSDLHVIRPMVNLFSPSLFTSSIWHMSSLCPPWNLVSGTTLSLCSPL